MLKIQEIREIIKLIDQSSIEKFSFESEGTKIVLKKGGGGQPIHAPVVEAVSVAQPGPAAAEAVQEQLVSVPLKKEIEVETVETQSLDDPSLHKITSPMVGTFYSSSSPEAQAYVQRGDHVNQESIVCIVEAMKLFNEIEAEVSGEIVEILVKDGQLIEYGQPLFLVKTK